MKRLPGVLVACPWCQRRIRVKPIQHGSDRGTLFGHFTGGPHVLGNQPRTRCDGSGREVDLTKL